MSRQKNSVRNILIRAAAVLLASLMLVFGTPAALRTAAAVEQTDDAAPLGWENDEDDPGFWRLSGILSEEEILELQGGDEEESETQTATQGSITSGSPFRSNTYTHNDAHERCLILNGVDVSSYQKDIDWNAARKAGVSFAFIRVGYRGYGGSGSYNEDKYYKQNLINAPKAGVNTGVYFYSQAISEAEAVQEADFILSRIKGYKVTLPVVFDYEYASTGGGSGGRLYDAHLTKDQATKVCLAFCDRVKAAGYEAMLYANKSMLNNQLNASQISSKYKIWLAHYTTKSNYDGDYDFWQYNSTGSCAGIPGAIDCNFWYVWVKAESIKLSESSITIKGGSSYKLKATLTPSNASNMISWSSSDSSIAAVSSDGEVIGVRNGTAVITASVGSLSAKCTVNVTVPSVSGVFVEKDKYSVRNGGMIQIMAHVEPETALNQNLRWSSSDEAVATVSQNGLVEGHSTGTAEISITAEEGGYTKIVRVVVHEGVTSLMLDRTALTLMKGKEYEAKVTMQPDNTGCDVEWSSANEMVAEVNENGLITAKGIGMTVITAKADGIAAAMVLTVTGVPITLRSSVRFSGLSEFTLDDLTFELRSIADESQVTTTVPEPTEQGAAFTLSAYEGDYSFSFTKPGFTGYSNSLFSAGADVFPSTVVMYAGDVNDDGFINVLDISVEKSKIGVNRNDEEYTTFGDFNADGMIDDADLSVMIKNLGQSDNIIE